MARRGRRLAIPRTLSLDGRRWKVRLVKRVPFEGGNALRGLCDADTRTIWIDARQSARERGITLVHEVLHALAGKAVALEHEEALVLRLEERLHDLLLAGAFAVVPDEAIRRRA